MRDFHVKHGACEVVLVRHAEAHHIDHPVTLDPKDVDLPLSERGHEQARLLAARLAKRELAALYTSPLKRALETADAIAHTTKLPIVSDARLREVEIAGVGPVALHDLAEIAIARGGWSHLPGTESSASVRGRMRDAINEIVKKHPGERIALVSHAGAINAYMSMLLALSGDFFFPAGNTSLSIVRARDDRRLIVTLNDTAHLEYSR